MWTVFWDDRARRETRQLDSNAQKDILSYVRHRIAIQDDPTVFGKALTGSYKGYWRYRIGNYRMICRIDKKDISILVIRVGHRKNVYE